MAPANVNLNDEARAAFAMLRKMEDFVDKTDFDEDDTVRNRLESLMRYLSYLDRETFHSMIDSSPNPPDIFDLVYHLYNYWPWSAADD